MNEMPPQPGKTIGELKKAVDEIDPTDFVNTYDEKPNKNLLNSICRF